MVSNTPQRRVRGALAILSLLLFTGPHQSGGLLPQASNHDEVLDVVFYQHPVDAPVIDPFRMDHGRFGPGNRGLEYGTQRGDPVFASAHGDVIVARVVVNRGVVTLFHSNGLRTAVTGLDQIVVQEGDSVRQGTLLGYAAGPIHFSIRDGDEYLDPAQFISSTHRRTRSRAVLVPTPPEWY